jgi:hypothetical protein
VGFQQVEAILHQLVVVRFVARGAGKFRNAGAFGKLDPDFWNQHAFEVETDKLHGYSPEVGAGDTPIWRRVKLKRRILPASRCPRGNTAVRVGYPLAVKAQYNQGPGRIAPRIALAVPPDCFL